MIIDENPDGNVDEVLERMKARHEERRAERRKRAAEQAHFDEAIVDSHLNDMKEMRKQIVEKGEWETEPDRVEFQHKGLACLIQRGPMMSWCGYVGLPPNHKHHGTEYQEIDCEVPCHGGLTYSDPCLGSICHRTEAADKLWWFGFDCSHLGDFIPGMHTSELLKILTPNPFRDKDVYRNQAYVTQEVKSMAEWFAAVGS